MANLKDIDFYESQEYLTKDVMNRPIEQLSDNVVDVNTELEQLLNDEIITTENGWSSHKIKQEIDSIDFEQVSQLDDNIITTEKGWSSNKINQEIEDVLDDDSISTGTGWSSFKINSMLGQSGGGGSFDDSTVSPVTGWTSQKIDAEIDAVLDDSITSLNFGWSSQKIANYVAANAGGGTGTGGSFPYWNVKDDFNAVGDGVIDDSAAFQNAYDTVGKGDVIVVPKGNYNITTWPFRADGKYVVWWTEGAYQADGITPLGGEHIRTSSEETGVGYVYNPTLPGLTKTSGTFKDIGDVTEEVLIKKTQTGKELANTRFVRIAEHTGGTGVATNLDIRTKVGENNTNFEWGLLSFVDNYSTDPSGGNVAVNGFIHKRNNSPSWGGQFAAFDYSSVPDSGVTGIEVNVSANGSDPNKQRILAQYVGFKRDPNGAKAEIGKGILIASYQYNTNNVKFGVGLELRSEFDIGIDLFNSTYNQSVIRIGSGKNIDFSPNGNGVHVMRHSPDIHEAAFVFRGSWIRPENGISFFFTTIDTVMRMKIGQKINFGGDYDRPLYYNGSTGEFIFANARLCPSSGINFRRTGLTSNSILFNDMQGITFGNSNDCEVYYNRSLNQLVVKSRKVHLTRGFSIPSGSGNVSANASSGSIIPPSRVQGYIVVPIDGIDRKIPFYNN